MPGGELPRDADEAMVKLVHSTECAEVIIDRHLDNPPHVPLPGRCCCNRCYPSLRPAQQYQWVPVNPAPPPSSAMAPTTDEQREGIYQELVRWRLVHWRNSWRDDWPQYGPKSLVSDADLNTIANHAGSSSAHRGNLADTG
ncbi:hypothetical protein FB45DRAFT_757724 [Roridomyces roridus]|uniref:Uncharacterized protein n=1 Tax=Roridomyces roridus TaxID=1738132 RepID=A0AAD7BB45_9AGAR|nr:hypothetical protein FB45DRAFT_757724 [Roridomyces roridus]